MCFNFCRKKEKADKNMTQNSSDPEFKKPEDKTSEVNKLEDKTSEVNKLEDKTSEVNKLEVKTSEDITAKVNKPDVKKPEVNKPEVSKPAALKDNAQNVSLQANQTTPLKEENKSSELDESNGKNKLLNIQKKKDVTSKTSLFLLKPDHKTSAGTLYEVDRDVFKKEKERLDVFKKEKERLDDRELNSFMYDFLSDSVNGGFIFMLLLKLSFNNILFYIN